MYQYWIFRIFGDNFVRFFIPTDILSQIIMCSIGMGPSWVKSPPCTIKFGWIRWKVHFRYPSPWTQGSFVLLPVSITLHKTSMKNFMYPSPCQQDSLILLPVYPSQGIQGSFLLLPVYLTLYTTVYRSLLFALSLTRSNTYFSHLGNPQPMQ